MKPQAARALRKQREMAEKIRSDDLNAYLTSDAPKGRVVPELIPTETELAGSLREYRRQVRLAAGEGRHSEKRNLLLDRALVALAHVVYVERVLALDQVARMALTPADLQRLSMVSQNDIWQRFNRLQRQEEMVRS